MTEAITTEFSLVGDELHALLVPFGEVGQAASGEHLFSLATALELPDPSSIKLKLAHDGSGAKQIAATATAFETTEAGIVAHYKPEANAYGKRLLKEHQEGRKKSVSPEFVNIIRDGANVLKAKLSGSAAVVLGGFPSAAFFSLAVADDVIEETDEDKIARLEEELLTLRSIPSISGHATETPETPAAPAAEEAPNQGDTVPEATVPNTVSAAAVATEAPITKQEVFAYFAALEAGNAPRELRDRMAGAFHEGGESAVFALNDVKYNGTGSVQPDERRSQWVDELWSGRVYERQVVPLFNHDTLTARIVSGFRWTTKPAGGDWAGNKANIPSNTPVTAAATATAQFWAMGHDHAIEHRIFNTPGYFESYFKMGTEDYAAWSDAEVLATILAGATALEADNPSGLDIGAGFSALIDGAAAVIAANALPTFALIAPALWKAMVKTPTDSVLGYLSAALKLDSGDLDGFVIRPHASLDTGNVLVGAREAATVYELPSIIKVEAPDTVKGGIDTNMIGAEATFIHKATALQLVTPYTP